MPIDSSIRLKSLSEMTLSHLQLLASGKVVAVIIDKLVTTEQAQQYSENIRVMCETSQYLWKSDLEATAPRSVGEAHESPQYEQEYFEGAMKKDQESRMAIYGHQSPADKISDHISAIWPKGVTIPQKQGLKFLSEISRRWKAHGGAHPHIDQSNTALLGPLGITVRLGVNTYLNMPPKGGEIEFWNRYISDDDYEKMKRSDYGVDRDVIGPADVVIRPTVGQAVIFRADRPHAVAPINEGRTHTAPEEDRITNACFLGMTQPTNPIVRFA